MTKNAFCTSSQILLGSMTNKCVNLNILTKLELEKIYKFSVLDPLYTIL